MTSIPIIDIGVFFAKDFDPKHPSKDALKVAKQVYDAFSSWGFLQITGHNVGVDNQSRLITDLIKFFNLPHEEKMALSVQKGGYAWRGYMPMGGEGTHGKLDLKEGMYFGYEHPDDHPKIGVPLFGKNQFPDTSIPSLRAEIIRYVDDVVILGTVMTGVICLSLGLDFYFIRDHYLQPEAIPLCRCFRYAARRDSAHKSSFGIGAHTDFGLLTILKQESAGLQVLLPSASSTSWKTESTTSATSSWVEVPVIDNAFVCNVGDMLDMMTGGRLKSRPHRVIASETHDRISIPFFFDFSWDAEMKSLPLDHLAPVSEHEMIENQARWNATTFDQITGTWSQYLAKKVQKIFPELKLPDFSANVAPSTRFNLPIRPNNNITAEKAAA